MTAPKTTPMIKQYLEIKERYQDAILFYRMGDFYEMFFEDAEKASKILEITLTSRNKKQEVPIPMCGIPYRAAQGYIARLIDNGLKVAICDQVEDPAKAKGLVKREVVRVVTPGMIVDNELLDAKSNNFILAVNKKRNKAGLSFLDISTGTFRIAESKDFHAIIDEVMRVNPSEILVPEQFKTADDAKSLMTLLADRAVSFMSDASFEYAGSKKRLMEQFGVLSLEGFGCEQMRSGVGAAGALLHYVRETQKQDIEHLEKLEPYHLEDYLVIDDLSSKNLELLANIRTGSRKGALIEILDQTITSMGARRLNFWINYPLKEMKRIEKRLCAVEEAANNIHQSRRIRSRFNSVYDLERLCGKIAMGRANARDLVVLKKSLQAFPDILSLLSDFQSDHYHYADNGAPLAEVAAIIEQSVREDAPPVINEGGIIKTGFNEELDELIALSRDGKGWLANLEIEEREKTGINSLKVRFNKVFGYYIEVSKLYSEKVPDHYIRKQTLVNAERYITDDLKTFESKVLGAEEKRATLEYELFNEIRKEVVRRNREISDAAAFIAQVDCLITFAEVADQNNYVRPDINTHGLLEIADGRHPVVEKLITGERFVPNSINMDNDENQILIITGPNMAGKSTILRQTALLVLMAHMGSFVPAKAAQIPVTDRIFTRVGALDNLSSGQSTFMVEMQETANILNNANHHSLVIMDEIGRGTSTFDGLSIAWAVAEHLHDLKGAGVKTMFATHYHELTELEKTKKRVKNYNIAVKEWNDAIIFLRKLVEGGTNRSYGIQVARLAGIPEKVIKRSKKVLMKVENSEKGLSSLKLDAKAHGGTEKGHRQMGLFMSAERSVVEKLQNLDLESMTPIDAINCLNELQEKSKDVIY